MAVAESETKHCCIHLCHKNNLAKKTEPDKNSTDYLDSESEAHYMYDCYCNNALAAIILMAPYSPTTNNLYPT